jgi:hypothetical protein
VGANNPDKMATDARAYMQAKAIKIKLTGLLADADRVRAVRAPMCGWVSMQTRDSPEILCKH